MALPNFLIVGFPKCGSTALHYFLANHPEIYMPKQKELHYFTSHILAKLNKGKGDVEIKKTQIKTIEQYRRNFKNTKAESAIGETSPSYINYPMVFGTINKTLNDPKIIVLLRDPIKRAYSNYLHLVRENREQLSFIDALRAEQQRMKEGYSDFWYYKFNSTYFKKAQELEKNFSDVLIITQENFQNNLLQTLKSVFQFLEVDPNFIPSNINVRYNAGGVFSKNAITNIIFSQNSYKSALKKRIGVPPWIKPIKQSILKQFKVKTPEITKEVEDYLIDYFKDDVVMLTQMGVDTSLWNPGYFTNR